MMNKLKFAVAAGALALAGAGAAHAIAITGVTPINPVGSMTDFPTLATAEVRLDAAANTVSMKTLGTGLSTSITGDVVAWCSTLIPTPAFSGPTAINNVGNTATATCPVDPFAGTATMISL